MVDAIVKLAGSVLCLGVGAVLLAFGLMVLSVFVVEVWNQVSLKLKK